MAQNLNQINEQYRNYNSLVSTASITLASGDPAEVVATEVGSIPNIDDTNLSNYYGLTASSVVRSLFNSTLTINFTQNLLFTDIKAYITADATVGNNGRYAQATLSYLDEDDAYQELLQFTSAYNQSTTQFVSASTPLIKGLKLQVNRTDSNNDQTKAVGAYISYLSILSTKVVD